MIATTSGVRAAHAIQQLGKNAKKTKKEGKQKIRMTKT